MVCPICHNKDTSVINSRQHRLLPQVWRRRTCKRCKVTFTTYEQVAEKELALVTTSKNTEIFSVAKLMLSIHGCLPSSPNQADHAYELAQNIRYELEKSSTATLTTGMIIKTTFETLSRFNPRAGLQYGLNHEYIDPKSYKTT